MTEYTTSSEAVREWMSARERTAMWVSKHSENDASLAFVSPSSPPSTLSDSDAPSYGPDSDDESTHSLPPRMVLRYGDGRPDIPIYSGRPTTNGSQSHSRSRSNGRPEPDHPPPHHVPSHVRSRSASHAQSMASRSAHGSSRHAQPPFYAPSHSAAAHQPATPPRSPESIVVLPSRQGDDTPQSIGTAAHNPSYYSPTQVALGVPLPASTPRHSASASVRTHHTNEIPHAPSHARSQHSIAAPLPRRPFDPSQIPAVTGSPQMAYSHSQPLPATAADPAMGYAPHHPSSRAQSQLPYAYTPPAIVYAPSSKHSKSRYAPPAIVYSPSATHRGQPRHAAPSMTYSHSDPLPHPTQYSPTGPAAYSQAPYHPAAAIPEGPEDAAHGRNFDGSRSRSRGRSRPGSTRARTPAHDPMPTQDPAYSPEESEEENDDRASRTSGSTYYVLPTPGQKVKLIVPNAASLYTATSTTKSAHSPQSAHPGYKKPFFQRIFHMPKLAGSMSSSDSRGHGGAEWVPPVPTKTKAHLWRAPAWSDLSRRRRAREREL